MEVARTFASRVEALGFEQVEPDSSGEFMSSGCSKLPPGLTSYRRLWKTRVSRYWLPWQTLAFEDMLILVLIES